MNDIASQIGGREIFNINDNHDKEYILNKFANVMKELGFKHDIDKDKGVLIKGNIKLYYSAGIFFDYANSYNDTMLDYVKIDFIYDNGEFDDSHINTVFGFDQLVYMNHVDPSVECYVFCYKGEKKYLVAFDKKKDIVEIFGY